MNSPIESLSKPENPIRVKSLDEIKAEINKSPKPNFSADKIITLGGCGFGMPVIKSYQALMSMPQGSILRMESEHACSFSDIHAWTNSNNDIELIGEDYENKKMIYFLRKI